VEVGDIGRISRQEVIDPDDLIAPIEQRLGEVRADETGGPSDHDALFHDVARFERQ
jgi:hypothetical protein